MNLHLQSAASEASFSGKDGFPIDVWIEDFEETANLMGWDNMQKFIFAKKSLTGLAKMFVKGERGITSWSKLKKALITEFEVEVTSADIHRLLVQRWMKKDETCQEYFLVMRELASRSDVDDKSLIQYVIDGIEDHLGLKSMLYGVRTTKQFKERLRDYETACERSVRESYKNEKQAKINKNDASNFGKEIKSTSGGKQTPKEWCYNCGSKDGHKSIQCKFKDKGPKCFNCNNFGHISSECTERKNKE